MVTYTQSAYVYLLQNKPINDAQCRADGINVEWNWKTIAT